MGDASAPHTHTHTLEPSLYSDNVPVVTDDIAFPNETYAQIVLFHYYKNATAYNAEKYPPSLILEHCREKSNTFAKLNGYPLKKHIIHKTRNVRWTIDAI